MPEWSQEDRLRNRTTMNNLYADEVMATWRNGWPTTPRPSLLEIALEHRIPLAPVRTYEEVRNDPSLADLFVEIDRADTGPVAYPGAPYRLANADTAPPTPAPTLGQHNREILCGRLGFSADELVKLYQTGII